MLNFLLLDDGKCGQSVCFSWGDSQWTLLRHRVCSEMATGMTVPIILLAVTLNPSRDHFPLVIHIFQLYRRFGTTLCLLLGPLGSLDFFSVYYICVFRFYFSVFFSVVSALYSLHLPLLDTPSVAKIIVAFLLILY